MASVHGLLGRVAIQVGQILSLDTNKGYSDQSTGYGVIAAQLGDTIDHGH
jgi:hypothetical protein